MLHAPEVQVCTSRLPAPHAPRIVPAGSSFRTGQGVHFARMNCPIGQRTFVLFRDAREPNYDPGLAAEMPHAMKNLKRIAWSSPLQERKHRRFALQYPVHLKIQAADSPVELEAVSRNISIDGLLLETSSMIPQHTPVSFTLTVEGEQVVRPIHFVGDGEVVRVDPGSAGQRFVIAVKCNRPIVRLDEPLIATGS